MFNTESRKMHVDGLALRWFPRDMDRIAPPTSSADADGSVTEKPDKRVIEGGYDWRARLTELWGRSFAFHPVEDLESILTADSNPQDAF